MPIDDYAPREPVTSCELFTDAELETKRRGVWLFRREVLSRWGGRDLGVGRACGDMSSMHEQSRAWDWGPAPEQALLEWQHEAQTFVAALTSPDEEGNANAWARRLGLRNIIFDRQIWNAGVRDWAPYNGPDSHTGHVHFDWSWSGALGFTSGFSELERGEGSRLPIFPFAVLLLLATAVAWAWYNKRR